MYWHTIGTVRVDPVDGTLWVGTGDANDEVISEHTFSTYDENTYRGKIMHIGRDGKGLPGHPFCPGDNDLTHVCTKIYAKGFRNPFRFSLRAGKGPIVGDVGAEGQEELDLLVPGGNYGWPCYEGVNHAPIFNQADQCKAMYDREAAGDLPVTPPTYTYDSNGGSSIAAGPLYLGSTYPPSYRNSIFIDDYVKRFVKRVKIDDQDKFVGVEDFATYPDGEGPFFVDIQALPDGNVGYLDLGWNGNPAIREYRFSGGNRTPVPAATGSPLGGKAPLKVRFDASNSRDPDGDAVTFAWDFGDGSRGTGVKPSHIYRKKGNYTATVTVSDDRGLSARKQVGPITPGNTAPDPVITTPAACTSFNYSSKLSMAGSATDKEDGRIRGSKLSWHVLQHHANHLHDFGTVKGARATVPTGHDHDADTYFIITLTATDSKGTSGSTTVRVDPNTIDFTLESKPGGAPMNYSSQTGAAPFPVASAVGYLTTISAAETFDKDGFSYKFTGWSDKKARQHTVKIPARNKTLTATYVKAGPAVAPESGKVQAKATAKAPIVKRCVAPGPIRSSAKGLIQFALDSLDVKTTSGYLTLSAIDNRKGHTRQELVIATNGFVLEAGVRRFVNLQLNSVGRALVRANGTLKVKLEFFSEDDGQEWVEHRTLRLARAR
jgi:PKD repeat protein